MSKRVFLRSMLAGVAAVPALPAICDAAKAAPSTSPSPSHQGSAKGPALLTISGQIGAGNRGPLDPALDRLLAKQNVAFNKAHTFDAAALAALPQVAIQPTLEYDSKRHTLQGPLLLDVVRATGAKVGDQTALLLRAIDGYAIQIDAAEAVKRRFILATHIDGQPMALGGLGPVWAVYEPDRFADMAAKPLKERFSLCPWATYHIEVLQS